MSDYNFLMESRLSPEQFRVIGHISRIAAEEGLNLYLAGGAVRDLTYGQQFVRDLDFVVEGNPKRILRKLDKASRGRKPPRGLPNPASGPPPLEIEGVHYNSRLQSAGLVFKNGVRAELAMARNEIYPRPGRRPEIVPSTIFEDLRRRDFSINAMAVSLHPNSRGLLLDPTNGGADVEARELRVLHSRSFADDPARIYRLLRLRLRLGFKIAEKTAQYLGSALEEKLWQGIDPDQQGPELRAILQEDNPGRVLRAFAERKMLADLDRKIARARIPNERFARIRAVVRLVPNADPLLLNFFAMVEKLGPGQKARLARKILGFRQVAALVLSFERSARKLARTLLSSRAATPGQVYTLLRNEPQPLLLFMLVYFPQAKVQNRIKNSLLKYPQVLSRLPRAELQGLGVRPGPQFEKIIEKIFFDQLEGKIKTQQQLMRSMRAYAGIKEPPPAKPAKAAKPAKPAAKAPALPATSPVPSAKPPAKPAAKTPALPVPKAEAKPAKPVPAKARRPEKRPVKARRAKPTKKKRKR